MAEALAIYEKELEEFEENITKLLDDKKIDTKQIDVLMDRYGNKLDMFNLECRAPNIDDPAKWKGRYRYHKEQRDQLNSRYTFKKLSEGALEGKKYDETTATSNEMMSYGRTKLQETKDSLVTSIQIVDTTKKLGIDITQQLEKQNKQISQMTDDVNAIGSDIERGSKIARRIARKLLTDKYIWIFILIVVILIVILILIRKQII